MSQNKLINLNNDLKTKIEEKAKAFPKNLDKEKFFLNCVALIQDNKDLQNANPNQVINCMLKGAFLGLDFFNKECYAIPYSGVVNFQTDYKGEIKIARMYSVKPIKDIYAKLVHEGDNLEISVEDGIQKVNFNPKLFSDTEIIGAFAVCYYEDGTMAVDVMSVKEIEATKEGYAKKDKDGKFSPSWRKSFGEMAKKTVLRRLCKLIQLDFDTVEQRKAYEEGSEFDMKRAEQEKEKIKVVDPFAKNENITDAEFKEEANPEIETSGKTEWEKEDEKSESEKPSKESVEPKKPREVCHSCGSAVTEKVKQYSLEKYSVIECYDCQKKR